jgi:hypothetical protein
LPANIARNDDATIPPDGGIAKNGGTVQKNSRHPKTAARRVRLPWPDVRAGKN